MKNKENKYYILYLAIEQDLEREKRKEEGKNQLLQRKYPEMWKAIKWLRNCDKNSIFVGQVFEPLFTQVIKTIYTDLVFKIIVHLICLYVID